MNDRKKNKQKRDKDNRSTFVINYTLVINNYDSSSSSHTVLKICNTAHIILFLTDDDLFYDIHS
jgi:hypothetical protein